MTYRESFLKAQSFHRTGKLGKAERAYRKLLKSVPGHPEVSFYLGMVLLQTGRGREAVNYFRHAAEAAPNNPVAHDHLGQALLRSGQLEKAVEAHRRAVILAPKQPEIIANLAWALDSTGSIQEAEERYQETLAIQPNLFPALANYGAMLHRSGRFRESVPLLKKAHQLNPKAPEPLATLCLAYDRTNEPEKADEVTDALMNVAPEHPACLLLRGMKLSRQKQTESAISVLREATRAALEPDHLAAAWFELARVLDDSGDFNAAFAAIRKGKVVREALPAFARKSNDEYRTRPARYREWFSAAHMPSVSAAPDVDAAPPVFFVGFPRSGTTLMEQILASHPAFVTTNETSPLERVLAEPRPETGQPLPLPDGLHTLEKAELGDFRTRFNSIAREIIGAASNDTRVIDKMPMNIVELGPANWLFPESAAIVALRDPRDVVLSCYMQRFRLNRAMIHFHSLESSALFYADVMSLWLHYRNVLTIRWTEYRYEDLVSDFDETVGKVLEFLGEDWDDSVTRYAEMAHQRDIRTPSYRSVTQAITTRAVGRWQNYREQLAPILPILEPFVQEFGYEPS